MKPAGFTLIELLIVLAIVGILVGVAMPRYQQYWLQSQRAEARDLLNHHAQRLEQYYTAQDSYAGYTPTTASSEHYTVAIATEANAYTLTATALGDQTQDTEDGVSCASLTWTQDGTRAPTACWR